MVGVTRGERSGGSGDDQGRAAAGNGSGTGGFGRVNIQAVNVGLVQADRVIITPVGRDRRSDVD